MSDLESPPWGFVFGAPWENPAWDLFVEEYPKELHPEWEKSSCPIVTTETNPELFQPIQASHQFSEIASVLHSHSASSLSAYCILGECSYGLMEGSQKDERSFGVQAKRAVLLMGYQGSEPLRFFLHQMRLWYCATPENVGGFEYPNVGAIISCKVRDGQAYKEHDARLKIDGVFQVAADFCWVLGTRFMVMPNGDETEIGMQPSVPAPVRQSRLRRSRTPFLLDHEKGIRAVIREGVVGERYAERLSEKGINPSESWVKSGCPKSYKLAFMERYWRGLIQKEKSRVMRRMNTHSPGKK